MSEDIVSELRQLLLEIVVPDLKLLVTTMDGLRHQMKLSQEGIEARLDALRLEVTGFRAEMRAMRREMDEFRTAHGLTPPVKPATQQESPNREERTAQPDGSSSNSNSNSNSNDPGKQWVN